MIPSFCSFESSDQFHSVGEDATMNCQQQKAFTRINMVAIPVEGFFFLVLECTNDNFYVYLNDFTKFFIGL